MSIFTCREINGILICYKIEPLNAPKRSAPPTPIKETETNHIQQQISNLKLQPNTVNVPLPPPRNNFKQNTSNSDNEYEVISSGYQVSPKRQAPRPPDFVNSYPTTTLYYSSAQEVSGVPFEISCFINTSSVVTVRFTSSVNDFIKCLFKLIFYLFQLPSFKLKPPTNNLDYDFQLEREILCTTKTQNVSKINSNPFFN